MLFDGLASKVKVTELYNVIEKMTIFYENGNFSLIIQHFEKIWEYFAAVVVMHLWCKFGQPDLLVKVTGIVRLKKNDNFLFDHMHSLMGE